ncbi:hypothetical protein [Streptomyces gilvosporeus]|uniref:Uncharacterized protein n=1 Tax=Streptomyces gilvosporeus TaxID=553510 RepID=A0A1V0TQJ2_9ACTN|nr:hypothetical protein [Streptomyces gilvosporeus]ARF55201.1 hypothetical protein B1H19_14225 [Streptomyces gilvosporeus]
MNAATDNDPPTGPATPSGLPGPVAFQLVLLRRMADHQPGLVEDALRTLGVSRADLREANRRWQARMHAPRAPGGLSPYRALLGAPESVTARRLGDMTCEALTWPVPLWPDLRFEVLTADRGAVWNAWLVRAPGAAAPALRTTADLAPWSCTVDEVARAFPPARPMEGSAPTRWALACTVPDPDPDAAPHALVTEFTWGLFQRLVDRRA